MNIYTKIIKKIFFWSMNYLYSYIDSDNDGKLSKKELKEFNKKVKSFSKLLK